VGNPHSCCYRVFKQCPGDFQITASVFSIPDIVTAGQPYTTNVQGNTTDVIEPGTILQVNTTLLNITGVISDTSSVEVLFCTVFNITCPYGPGNLTLTSSNTIPVTAKNMTIQVNQTYSGMLLSCFIVSIYPHNNFFIFSFFLCSCVLTHI